MLKLSGLFLSFTDFSNKKKWALDLIYKFRSYLSPGISIWLHKTRKQSYSFKWAFFFFYTRSTKQHSHSPNLIPQNYIHKNNTFITNLFTISEIWWTTQRADYLSIFSFINRRLVKIKSSNLPFGGLNIVVIGDFFLIKASSR